LKPTIVLWTIEEGDQPQRVDDANVRAGVAEPVEQGESRHTTLDINQPSLTNDRGTDRRPETHSETRMILRQLKELNKRVQKVSFPPRCNTNMAHQLMSGFEQVEARNAKLKRSNVEFKEGLKTVSFPPRCNTNMAHQLMSGFEQVEGENVELKEDLKTVSFPPRCNTNIAHQLMSGFEQVKLDFDEKVKKVSFPPRCNTNMAHQLMCGFNSSPIE
jgi:hypothetical protein